MRYFWLVVLALMLGACEATGTDNAETSLRGTVVINALAPGTVIYGETITVNGSAEGVPDGLFGLQIVDSEGVILVDIPVNVIEGNWSVEVVHGWLGEPSEFSIVARAQNASITQPYDEQSILIGGGVYRPDGIYGNIFIPTEGTSIGGDSVLVVGNVSGVAMGRLRLALLVEGERIREAILSGDQTSLRDDSVWEASLALGTVRGIVTIELYYEDDTSSVILDSITVMVDVVAG